MRLYLLYHKYAENKTTFEQKQKKKAKKNAHGE